MEKTRKVYFIAVSPKLKIPKMETSLFKGKLSHLNEKRVHCLGDF